MGGFARRPRGMGDAVMDRDARLGGIGARQCLGLFGHVPQPPRGLAARQPFKLVHLEPLTGPELPSVPTRSAEAHPLRFQQHDLPSRTGQRQRRRQARVAAADHDRIRPRLAAQTG